MARPRTTGKPKAIPKANPNLPPQLTAPIRQRDAKGRIVGKDAAMKANTYQAFKLWFDDRQPCILTDRGKYEYVPLTRKQESTLKRILQDDGKGGFQYDIALPIWPRRHAKSVTIRLVCLWLLDTRENYTVQLWGNSEAHSREVGFMPICKMILHTPALRKRIPEKGLRKDEIQHGTNGSRIKAMVGGSVVFGGKVDLLWVDDYHHNPDLESVHALEATLLDQQNSMMVITSNVDPIDGHVHAYQKIAETDPGIYCDHLLC